MTKEEIDKWLYNEYGMSYTGLEELHDIYFVKCCNLQQENKKLKDNWNKLKEYMIKEQARIVIENTDEDEFVYTELLVIMQELEKGESNE